MSVSFKRRGVEKKRNLAAQQVALSVLADYGDDPDSYGDRLLEICKGNRPLADDVARECLYLSGLSKRPASKQSRKRKKKRHYAEAV